MQEHMYLTQVITFNTDNIIVTYLLKISVAKHFSVESSYNAFCYRYNLSFNNFVRFKIIEQLIQNNIN